MFSSTPCSSFSIQMCCSPIFHGCYKLLVLLYLSFLWEACDFTECFLFTAPFWKTFVQGTHISLAVSEILKSAKYCATGEYHVSHPYCQMSACYHRLFKTDWTAVFCFLRCLKSDCFCEEFVSQLMLGFNYMAHWCVVTHITVNGISF